MNYPFIGVTPYMSTIDLENVLSLFLLTLWPYTVICVKDDTRCHFMGKALTLFLLHFFYKQPESGLSLKSCLNFFAIWRSKLLEIPWILVNLTRKQWKKPLSIQVLSSRWLLKLKSCINLSQFYAQSCLKYHEFW